MADQFTPQELKRAEQLYNQGMDYKDIPAALSKERDTASYKNTVIAGLKGMGQGAWNTVTGLPQALSTAQEGVAFALQHPGLAAGLATDVPAAVAAKIHHLAREAGPKELGQEAGSLLMSGLLPEAGAGVSKGVGRMSKAVANSPVVQEALARAAGTAAGTTVGQPTIGFLASKGLVPVVRGAANQISKFTDLLNTPVSKIGKAAPTSLEDLFKEPGVTPAAPAPVRPLPEGPGFEPQAISPFTGREMKVPGATESQSPTASFIGDQEGVGKLYNIKGGPLHNSTVTADTLTKHGIPIVENTSSPKTFEALAAREPQDVSLSGKLVTPEPDLPHPGIARDAALEQSLLRPVPDVNPGAGLLPATKPKVNYSGAPQVRGPKPTGEALARARTGHTSVNEAVSPVVTPTSLEEMLTQLEGQHKTGSFSNLKVVDEPGPNASGGGMQGSQEENLRNVSMKTAGKAFKVRNRAGVLRDSTADGALALRPGESFGELGPDGTFKVLNRAGE